MSASAVLEIVLACASTFAAAAILAGVARRRRALALVSLERYAHAHRLRFTAPSGAARSPRIEGVARDVAFAIDLARIDGCLRTRVSAAALRGRAPRLHVVQRGRVERAFAADGAPRDALAAGYRVASPEADGAREAVASLGAALSVLDERRGVWLASDGGRIVCSWEGIEAEGRVLDAARDAVTSVARLHAPDVPYR